MFRGGLNKGPEGEGAAEELADSKAPAASLVKAGGPSPQIKKGLQGLPPALLEKILQKEKAKQIKQMTQNSVEKKDEEMARDLQEV